jgi:hypothetical protein
LTNPFDPMQLTPRDMFRAAPVLKDQAGLTDVDPYDLLDVTGDRYLRRVLVIWCLKSRDDPDFTWEQAWDVPFGDLFDDADDADAEDDGGEGEPGEAPPTPGTGNAGTGPGSNGNAGSKRKRRGATPEPNSAASSP